MPNPTIQDLIRQYQQQLDVQNAESVARLLEAYKRAYDQLSQAQDALILEVQAMRAAGKKITAAKINKLRRYRELLQQTAQQMDHYAGIIEDEVARAAPGAVYLGAQQAEDMVRTLFSGIPEAMQAQIIGTWQRLPDEAIQALIGALQAQSPLARITLAGFGAQAAQGIGEALVMALLSGKGPRETAARMAREWGIPLTRALTIARTEQIRAHRMAAMASYRANGHIVKGWIWHAQMDTRTCLSCIAQHGSEHPLGEDLDDHVAGRCVAVPITVSFAEMGLEGMEDYEFGRVANPGDGERWFSSLPEEAQRKMMGAGKYDAWRAGRFSFAKLSKAVYDDDWGRSFVETPLYELVGEGA